MSSAQEEMRTAYMLRFEQGSCKLIRTEPRRAVLYLDVCMTSIRQRHIQNEQWPCSASLIVRPGCYMMYVPLLASQIFYGCIFVKLSTLLWIVSSIQHRAYPNLYFINMKYQWKNRHSQVLCFKWIKAKLSKQCVAINGNKMQRRMSASGDSLHSGGWCTKFCGSCVDDVMEV